MSLTRWLYFDLEETVIDSWDSGLLRAPGAMRAFTRAYAPDHLGVFSFAISDAMDARAFERRFRAPLERTLDRHIERVVTVEELRALAFGERAVRWDETDFHDLHTKGSAFQLFARQHRAVELVLVDDAVEALTVQDHFRRTTTHLVPVREAARGELPGWLKRTRREAV